MRCEHTEHEWAAIKPFLPNRPRGMPRERSPIMSLDSRFFDDRGQRVYEEIHSRNCARRKTARAFA